MVDNILTGDFLIRPGWAALFDMAAILALALLAALLIALTTPVIGGVLAVLAGAAYLWVAYYFFLEGWLLRTVHPILALAASGVAIIAYR